MDYAGSVDCRGYFANSYDKYLPISTCGQDDSTS